MSSTTTAVSPSRSVFRRYLFVGLAVVIVVAVAATLAWRTRGPSKAMFVEYPMTVASDIPAALAIGPDGAVCNFSKVAGLSRVLASPCHAA